MFRKETIAILYRVHVSFSPLFMDCLPYLFTFILKQISRSFVTKFDVNKLLVMGKPNNSLEVMKYVFSSLPAIRNISIDLGERNVFVFLGGPMHHAQVPQTKIMKGK